VRPEYIKLDTEKPVYIRKDRLSEIAEVYTTVFDCARVRRGTVWALFWVGSQSPHRYGTTLWMTS